MNSFYLMIQSSYYFDRNDKIVRIIHKKKLAVGARYRIK